MSRIRSVVQNHLMRVSVRRTAGPIDPAQRSVETSVLALKSAVEALAKEVDREVEGLRAEIDHLRRAPEFRSS